MAEAAFTKSLEERPVQVNNASLVDIKIALDDTVVRYFAEVLGYKQDHRFTDKNLAVQFVLNLISGMTALYAYAVPFSEGIALIGLACLVFFLLNATWGLYYYFLVVHPTFAGAKGNTTVRVTTDMHPPTTIYHISAIIGADTLTLAKPVEQWFDPLGTLDPIPFVQDLQKLVQPVSDKKTK